METTQTCKLTQFLRVVPTDRPGYEHLARFHYPSSDPGPIRSVDPPIRRFVEAQVDRFCRKFTNR
jgi:hypothetical protein